MHAFPFLALALPQLACLAAAQAAAESPMVYCEGQVFRCWKDAGSTPWQEAGRKFPAGFYIKLPPKAAGPDAPVEVSFQVNVPFAFAQKVVERIETGRTPNWKLTGFEFALDGENAGSQLMGHARLTFAQSGGPSVVAAAVAECSAQFAAITAKVGEGVLRPAAVKLQHDEAQKRDTLELAFDVVGEHYRSSYATAVAMFEGAAQAKGSPIRAVRADPREKARADGKGASYTMSLEMRAADAEKVAPK